MVHRVVTEGKRGNRLGSERGPQTGRRHDRPLFILGMGWFNDWRSAFYVPAAAAAAIAVIAFFVMRDTPAIGRSAPIEEYKNDYPKDYNESHEQEFPPRRSS